MRCRVGLNPTGWSPARTRRNTAGSRSRSRHRPKGSSRRAQLAFEVLGRGHRQRSDRFVPAGIDHRSRRAVLRGTPVSVDKEFHIFIHLLVFLNFLRCPKSEVLRLVFGLHVLAPVADVPAAKYSHAPQFIGAKVDRFQTGRAGLRSTAKTETPSSERCRPCDSTPPLI